MMPDHSPITDEQWQVFLSSLSPEVRDLAEKYPPWECFELSGSGHHAHVIGYWDPLPSEGYGTAHLKCAVFVEAGVIITILHVLPGDLQKVDHVDSDLPRPSHTGPGGVTLH